jgi:hypothetical protein
VSLFEKGKAATTDEAEAKLLLAGVLWDAPNERARAAALAARAQELYLTRHNARGAAQAEAWLKRHAAAAR